MNRNRSPLLYFLLFLAFVQIAMLVAVGIIPVAQSADLSALQSPPHLDLSAADQSAALADLTTKSDLVVQAQVVESRSQWNYNHTVIETAHKLTVRQRLLGPTTTEIEVYTDGGFLPDEGLGMFSSHTPRFAIGEVVLVFLQWENNRYQVTDGEAGKFTIFQENAASAYYRDHLPLTQIATILAKTNRANDQAIQSITEKSRELSSTTAVQATRTAPLVTTTPTPQPKWSGATPQITLKVNLNSTQIGGPAGSADQFLSAIKGALRTWSVIPEAGATLLYGGPITSTTTSFNRQSEILFMKKGINSQLGQAQIWFTSAFVIVEADLWINDDYLLDATGNPENSEIDLESIVLHELGHWLPLSHLPNMNAVMYAVLGSGLRKTVLNNDDIAGVTALYPCPAVPCIDPAYAGDTTPTPTVTVTTEPVVTPTATITPNTITPTPTIIPTAVTVVAKQNSFLPLVTR